MTVVPGSRLGPYQILGPLGEGGMGEVYRAHDPRFRREVAVKVLPADFTTDPERLKRFEHEARAAGALNHPNILTVHDLGTADGVPYLVTELLEGETLRERITRGIVPLPKALEWAAQIARGLAAAHEKGIVHRDLKPENLFVTKDGRVKILDFGLARLERAGAGIPGRATMTATMTEAGMLMGTAGYMAPEQVRGEPADARSDLFAFGCVLYEMIAGKRAFAGNTAVETMAAILNAEPEPVDLSKSKAPSMLEALMRHCLEKEPASRFQSTRDLVFALEAIGGTPMAERRPTPGLLRTARLSTTIALVLVLAAVAYSAALFSFARRTANPSPPVFKRLTFRRGTVDAACFAPDGQTIVYSAAWDGEPARLFTTRTDSRESSPLPLPEAGLFAVSSQGELAISIGPNNTLARVPLAGGAPREVLDEVTGADWSPDGSKLAVVRRIAGTSRLEYPPGQQLYQSLVWIALPRISPRGDHVAFLEASSLHDSRGSVAVVDPRGRVVARSRVWTDQDGLAWSPRGDAVWFTAADSGGPRSLFELTLKGHERLLLRVPGALRIFDRARDGRILLARDDRMWKSIGLPPGSSRERDLSWMDWSVANDLSADGRQVLITDCGEAAGSRYAVGMRKTDGSPVAHLGEGWAGGLSSDGAWAVAIARVPRDHIIALPTGAGSARTLDPGPVTQISWSSWVAGTRRVLFAGWEGDRGPICYSQDIEGGLPHAITPDSVLADIWMPSSPDGRAVLVRTRSGRALLWPIATGAPRPVPGLAPDATPVGWCDDGRSIFVRSGRLPARIERMDLATGRREFVREFMPADAAGVHYVSNTLLTPDGRSYVYVYGRVLSDLYLVEELR